MITMIWVTLVIGNVYRIIHHRLSLDNDSDNLVILPNDTTQFHHRYKGKESYRCGNNNIGIRKIHGNLLDMSIANY